MRELTPELINKMLKNYLRAYATVRVVFLTLSPHPLLVSASISTTEFLSDV